MSGLVYPMLFYDKPRREGLGWIHSPRDPLAAMEIVDALVDEGFRYGGPRFNVEPAEEPPPGAPLRSMDVHDLGPDDLILVVTRPPQDDDEEDSRLQVARGWTDVEAHILSRTRLLFTKLSRGKIIVADGVRELLPERCADRGRIQFQLTWPPRYLSMRADGQHRSRLPKDENRTAGYLIRMDELWPGGPGLLVAFSLAGDTTLVWAHCLRTRFPELLRRRGFVIGELSIPSGSPRPTSLAEAGVTECRADIVLQTDESVFAPN
jgi:hypothetical protein